MNTSHRSLALTIFALCIAACATRPPPTPVDATTDAMAHAGPRTFTLTLIDDDLVVARGERISIDVRIDRQGGFDAPVLVELAGLPDGLDTLARESRPGDELTSVTIVANDDAEPIDRAAFVVQASTLDGLRQIAPARVTVR